MSKDPEKVITDADRWIAALERQVQDLRTSYAALDQRYQAACREAERLAPLARESYQLKLDCCVYIDRIARLESRVAELERENRLLREIAEDGAEMSATAALVLKEAMAR